MSARYDATTKSLVETAPEDWLALCGHDIRVPVRLVDADLSTITTMADKVLLIEQPEPWMAHFEFQSSYDNGIGLRLLRYSVLIEYRHQLPVQSILVLLKPEADGPAARGIARRSLPSGSCYDEFKFQTIRIWELPVEDVLTGGLGTLPLAPISDVAESQLPTVIRRMTVRAEREIAPERQSEFWASTVILMGARYSFPFIDTLLQGVINMRESSVVQHFLQEGREEGLEEGVEIGQAREARKIMLQLVQRRFGAVDPKLQRYVDAISDVAQLETLIYRTMDVASWEELLA